jgi:hypothetical protein
VDKWLGAAVVAATLSILILLSLGVSGPQLYGDPLLYYGGAVLQAYAALVAIPFTIWVIYMQSRFGSLVLRLFAEKVAFPFIILGVVVVSTGICIALARTGYADEAYWVTLGLSIILLPPIVSYVRGLMTMDASEVLRSLERRSRSRTEFVSSALRLLRLYIAEAYHDEETINRIMTRIYAAFRRIDEIEPQPEVWHRFRELLRTILIETGYLPPIGPMRRIMTSFMAWLIKNKRDRVARMFIRYYRRLAQRYLEERQPTEVVTRLLVQPTLTVARSMKAPKTLQAYAVDQLHGFLKRVLRAASYGDYTSREICRIADLLEEAVSDMQEMHEARMLLETIKHARETYHCVSRRKREEERKR